MTDIIKDCGLQYHEKRQKLAIFAENSLPYVKLNKETAKLLEQGIICDVLEGHAPYRPRYILPDYTRYMTLGSEYLNIEPPKDMYEAINALTILYRFVPSITSYPVYLGQIDTILEKYRETVSETELERLLKMFLIQIDRTLPDGFVHLNIGPQDTSIDRSILKLEQGLKQAVPNISLKYSSETSDEFAKLAIAAALDVGKPYFVNHKAIVAELGEAYGLASCYNSLPIGGGSHTLVRLNLLAVAGLAKNSEDFLHNILPIQVEKLCEVINARARFLVEETKFFESSFLAREGLISLDRFTSMAGIFGLYECVEKLCGKLGQDLAAEELAFQIVENTVKLIKRQPAVYCGGTKGRIGFHAQSGIDTDKGVTAGVRIKSGYEPELFEQLRLAGRLHEFFDTGVSEICVFDQTAKNSLDGILTIIKGALGQGIKTLAISSEEAELIRVTGYLVKKTDLEKHKNGKQVREDTVKLGADNIANCNILKRVIRSC